MNLTSEGPCIIFAIYIHSSKVVPAGRIRQCGSYDIPQSAHTVSTKKLLRMDRYGPKHVELTPEYSINKHLISVTTLCISLECIYIAKQFCFSRRVYGPPEAHSWTHQSSMDHGLKTPVYSVFQLWETYCQLQHCHEIGYRVLMKVVRLIFFSLLTETNKQTNKSLSPFTLI